MQITHHAADSVEIVEVTGRAAGLAEAGQFREFFSYLLDDLIDVSEPRIVLDLSRLARADSGFIGAMLVCNERVRNRNGTLKLVLAGITREVFLIAGLDSLFEIYDRRTDALKSFATTGSSRK